VTSKPRSQRILPGITVKTRDGFALSTDVHLNPVDAPAPTVIVRTPYGRNLPTLLRMASRLCQAGFCVLLQDCRGRYKSQGQYDWLREEDDTYDTLCWVAEQPWSNRRVGLYGMSVTANPNYFVAAAPPPGVVVGAMVAVMGSVNHHRTAYNGGALTLHWALPWSVMMDSRHMGRTTWQRLPWAEVFQRRPLRSATEGHIETPEIWLQMIASAREEPWASDATRCLDRVSAPTLHLSGWNDFMLQQTLNAFQAMAGSPAQAPQKLVVGPWDHGTLFHAFGTQTSAAPTESAAGVDLLELIAGWFSRWLAGEGPPQSNEPDPPVLLHLAEDGGWLGAGTFPLDEAETVDLYLSSGGRAAGSSGDGLLLRDAPPRTGYDTFTYDPDNPVPTVGGALWPFPAGGMVPGPLDQTEVEQRADVLVYTSEPLGDDLYVVGPVVVELWAATSARDTDFTAKLVDVDRSDVPRIVQDGIVRGRFHRTLDREELLEPHRPVRFTILVPGVARRFRSGHRIRLEISSSNFPKYDRNLNVAAAPADATTAMIARQTVYHGGEMASRLRLAVIPPARIPALRATPAAYFRAGK
jgi:hypothetical protein